ncbi:unnamed protein product [Lymnaea stagnalis]|uniref:Major facilitator superfamily (MFS) profile domain-containing protein n=1 Tax=Lymnaea stagnalis TaxID=6523 RepID=A0AAV2IJ53_LYMST
MSLLKNYLVILQLVSFSLNNMCLFLPVYLPAHAEKTGISQTDAANLMTIAGLCDTSARIVFGFLGDLKLALPSRVIVLASLYMGVVCHFVALFTDLGSLVFLAVSMGLLGLSSVSYNPNLAVELVGVDHMGKMLALSQLVSTVWFSIQYPIHGE